MYDGTLTAEHLRIVDEVRAEAMAVALATGPLDHDEVEASILRVYDLLGRGRPSIHWVSSPTDQLLSQLQAQPWDQLRTQLRDQLRTQLRAQLRAQLWTQLADQLGAQLWVQLRAQLRDQLWDQLRDQVGPWADAYWLTLREAACRVTGLDGPLVTLLRAVRAATVTTWAPYTDAVIICERPTVLHVDQQGRLHADDGPALHYPDGWAIWSWHGTTVPENVITPGWAPRRILTEPNLEIRRAAIERLGWPEFVDQAGLTLVATTPDPGNPGCDLHLYDVPEQVYGAHVRVLVCRNATLERDGTRRAYGLTVPADISDPVHAAAWTFNIPSSTYRELARAT